jgi:hypothetical protein
MLWFIPLLAAQAALGAYSALSQGQAQSGMANYNALIARQNAQLVAKQMELAKTEKGIIANRTSEQANKVLASQRVGYAKAGVTSEGTPEMVAAETENNANIDALAIRYASTVEQAQLLSQKNSYDQAATLEKIKGKLYSSAGYLQAGNSLLSAGTNAYMMNSAMGKKP